MVAFGKTGTTSSMYGIYLTNSGNMDIHSNNVLVSDGGASSRAFYATSGGATGVFSNNFTNYTAGYGVYVASSFSVSDMNYNNIHSPGGNVGYFGVNQATLGDWQTASGFDANGLDIDPLYYSHIDLHVCNDTLDGAGISHASVIEDFDGQPRDASTPDIGADEFAPVNSNFLGDDAVFCVGETITLWAGSPSDTTVWSTGDTTNMTMVSTAGIYIANISGPCGSGSELVVITELTAPTAAFTWVNSFATGIFTNTAGASGTPSYAWAFGDANTSTDSHPTHIYGAIGTYYVTLTVTNECGSDTFGDSITLSSVGLNDMFATGDVSVFPNPSTGEFTISMDVLTSTDVEIRIENVLGAIVYESTPGVIEGVHTEEVNLGGSPAGMYFIRILAGEGQLVKKIILE